MKKYIVKGSFKIDNKTWRHFEKTIQSNNEKNAREKIYSLLGSKHKLKRNKIEIDIIKEE